MDQYHPITEEGTLHALESFVWLSCLDQILDLEARLAQALEESSHMSTVSTGNKRTNPDWLPTSGARHTLTGHRNVVTAVAFHPIYSSLVSASEDTTLRVWDWESGELERTLKGHTRHVTDCQYDSKGKFLGASFSS